jgi:hypothetical protein
MPFCFVLLENRPRGYLLGSPTITPGPLCTFLDMLIFPLFLRADTA